MHSYQQYVNPHLGKLLHEIGLDKQFVSGKGCYLYDEQGNEYLDFIAAYGALPFGYNPTEIWQAINQIQETMEPSFIQPSFLGAAGELAEKLIQLAPGDLQYVTFANSGAEAVEAAIKMCRSATGRMGILTTNNSFHGKTLGALSATGNPDYQQVFGAPVPGFKQIPYGNIAALRNELAENGETYAALFLEPIQGEGGIVTPPEGYLKQAKALCEEYGILLVLDEIQTGLGRTGTLFACEAEKVTPDVLLLAKALGGGIVPIGAVLANEKAYNESFALKHSSTFAGNSLGARVGLRVLDILQRNQHALINEVGRKGELLRAGLEKIKAKYPGVIRQIRGKGLMLGIDFEESRDLYPDSLLGVMVEQKALTPMVASYLLNTEGLRVAPTLNGASVIRVEPPLVITDEQIERGLRAIEKAVRALASRDTATFLGHLVGYKALEVDIKPPVKREKPQPSGDSDEGRFSFLIHPVDLKNYTDFDASMQVFDERQIADLSSRWNDMVEPFVVSGTKIISLTGAKAYGEFICVPRTAEQLLNMPKDEALAEVRQAVELAHERGAKLVGLGAYTSVVTVGGRSLVGKVDVPITTGNSYTVISGVEALTIGATKLGMQLNNVTAAVVGAGGAIGKASATLLAEEVKELILVGNPNRQAKSEHRMHKVVANIFQHITTLAREGRQFAEGTLASYIADLTDLPANDGSLGEWLEVAKRELAKDCPIYTTVNAKKFLPGADIILAATSSTEAMITSSMLKWGALICDMSRPANVSKEVLERRKDVLVIDGGIIEVPHRPDLGWNFGFDQGLAYACMSETMMLGIEQEYENASIGADLNLDHIRKLRELADKHGFRLAGFRSFDQPIDEKVWEEVIKVRQRQPVNERGA